MLLVPCLFALLKQRSLLSHALSSSPLISWMGCKVSVWSLRKRERERKCQGRWTYAVAMSYTCTHPSKQARRCCVLEVLTTHASMRATASWPFKLWVFLSFESSHILSWTILPSLSLSLSFFFSLFLSLIHPSTHNWQMHLTKNSLLHIVAGQSLFLSPSLSVFHLKNVVVYARMCVCPSPMHITCQNSFISGGQLLR